MMTGGQYRIIEDAVLYYGNKVNRFDDARVVKALERAGYIQKLSGGDHGFDYIVTGSAITAAITYLIKETIGAKVQPINRLVSKYVENGGTE